MPSWMKGLLALLVFLALAYGLTLVSWKTAGKTGPSLPADPVKIEMTQPGLSLTVEKADGEWRIKKPLDFPADEETVRAFLEEFKNMEVGESLSERAESHALFDVTESSGLWVRVWGKGSRDPSQWLFGKMPDYIHVYLCFPPKPQVYLARGFKRYEAEMPLAQWRKRRLVETAAGDALETVSIRRGKTLLDLHKSSEAWTVNGEKAGAGKVEPFVSALETLTADDFIDPPGSQDLKKWGLDQAPTAFTLSFRSGKTLTLEAGRPDPESRRVPLRRNSENVLFWLAEWRWQSLDKTAKDFLP